MNTLAQSELTDLQALSNLLVKGSLDHGWTASTQVGVLLGFLIQDGSLAEACDYVRGVLDVEAMTAYYEGDTTETFADEGSYR